MGLRGGGKNKVELGVIIDTTANPRRAFPFSYCCPSHSLIQNDLSGASSTGYSTLAKSRRQRPTVQDIPQYLGPQRLTDGPHSHQPDTSTINKLLSRFSEIRAQIVEKVSCHVCPVRNPRGHSSQVALGQASNALASKNAPADKYCTISVISHAARARSCFPRNKNGMNLSLLWALEPSQQNILSFKLSKSFWDLFLA